MTSISSSSSVSPFATAVAARSTATSLAGGMGGTSPSTWSSSWPSDATLRSCTTSIPERLRDLLQKQFLGLGGGQVLPDTTQGSNGPSKGGGTTPLLPGPPPAIGSAGNTPPPILQQPGGAASPSPLAIAVAQLTSGATGSGDAQDDGGTKFDALRSPSLFANYLARAPNYGGSALKLNSCAEDGAYGGGRKHGKVSAPSPPPPPAAASSTTLPLSQRLALQELATLIDASMRGGTLGAVAVATPSAPRTATTPTTTVAPATPPPPQAPAPVAQVAGIVPDGPVLHTMLHTTLRELLSRGAYELVTRMVLAIVPWNVCEVNVRMTLCFNTLHACLPSDDTALVDLVLDTWSYIRDCEQMASNAIYHDASAELMRCAMEWLLLDARVDRRVTALSILLHLLGQGSRCTNLISVHLPQILLAMWNPLKDPQPTIREKAAATLEYLLESALGRVGENEECDHDEHIQQFVQKACQLCCGGGAGAVAAGGGMSSASPHHASLLLQTPLAVPGTPSYLQTPLSHAGTAGGFADDSWRGAAGPQSETGSVSELMSVTAASYTTVVGGGSGVQDYAVHAGTLAIGALLCAEQRLRRCRLERSRDAALAAAADGASYRPGSIDLNEHSGSDFDRGGPVARHSAGDDLVFDGIGCSGGRRSGAGGHVVGGDIVVPPTLSYGVRRQPSLLQSPTALSVLTTTSTPSEDDMSSSRFHGRGSAPPPAADGANPPPRRLHDPPPPLLVLSSEVAHSVTQSPIPPGFAFPQLPTDSPTSQSFLVTAAQSPLPTAGRRVLDEADYSRILISVIRPKRLTQRLYGERLLPLLALHDIVRFQPFALEALRGLTGHATSLLREAHGPPPDSKAHATAAERLNETRSVVLSTIGLLYSAMGNVNAELERAFVDEVAPLLLTYLAAPPTTTGTGHAVRCRVDAAATALALIVEAFNEGQREAHMDIIGALLDHTLNGGVSLSVEVAGAAARIHETCPALRSAAQAGVLRLVSQALKIFALPQSLATAQQPHNSHAGGHHSNRQRDIRDAFLGDLAHPSLIHTKLTAFQVLKHMCPMRWRGSAAAFFVKVCSPYVHHPDPRVRRGVIDCCSPLLAQDCEDLSTLEDEEAHEYDATLVAAGDVLENAPWPCDVEPSSPLWMEFAARPNELQPHHKAVAQHRHHRGRSHMATLRQVVHLLLDVAVADPLAELRHAALTSLEPNVFDVFMVSQESAMDALFNILNDEVVANRRLALQTLGRVAHLVPSVALPRLRRVYVVLLSDLMNDVVMPTASLGLDERLVFLHEVARTMPVVVLPMYLPNTLSVLQSILCSSEVSSPVAISTALEMTQYLLEESDESSWSAFSPFFALARCHVDVRHDTKMLCALNLLQSLVKCISSMHHSAGVASARGLQVLGVGTTGGGGPGTTSAAGADGNVHHGASTNAMGSNSCDVLMMGCDAYHQYVVTDSELQATVNLLHSLVRQRTVPLSPSVSIAVMRLLGILAAVEPLQAEPFVPASEGIDGMDARRHADALSGIEDARVICDGTRGWPFEVLHYLLRVLSGGVVPLSEEDQRLTIAAILRIFNATPSVARHFHAFLGPFFRLLEQLLATARQTAAVTGGSTVYDQLQETVFTAIAQLLMSDDVSRSAYAHAATIVHLVRQHWFTERPALLSRLCDVISALNRHATEPLHEYVSWFVSSLLAALSERCVHVGDLELSVKLLMCIESFRGASTSNTMLLVIPALCNMLTRHKMPPEIKCHLGKALVRFMFSCDVDPYIARIVECCAFQLSESVKQYAPRVVELDRLRIAFHKTKDHKRRSALELEFTKRLEEQFVPGLSLVSSSLARIAVSYTRINHNEVKRFPLPQTPACTAAQWATSLLHAADGTSLSVAACNTAVAGGGGAGTTTDAELPLWQHPWEGELVAIACAAAGRCRSFDEYHAAMTERLKARFGARSDVVRFFNSCANPASHAVLLKPMIAYMHYPPLPYVADDEASSVVTNLTPYLAVGGGAGETRLTSGDLAPAGVAVGMTTAIASKKRSSFNLQDRSFTGDPAGATTVSSGTAHLRQNARFLSGGNSNAMLGAGLAGRQVHTPTWEGDAMGTPLTSSGQLVYPGAWLRNGGGGGSIHALVARGQLYPQTPSASCPVSPDKAVGRPYAVEDTPASSPTARSTAAFPRAGSPLLRSSRMAITYHHHHHLSSLDDEGGSAPSPTRLRGHPVSNNSHAHNGGTPPLLGGGALMVVPAGGLMSPSKLLYRPDAALIGREEYTAAAARPQHMDTLRELTTLFEQHAANRTADYKTWFEQLVMKLVHRSRQAFVSACEDLARRHYAITCALFPWAFLSHLMQCNEQEREDWLLQLDAFERRHRSDDASAGGSNKVPLEIMQEMTNVAHLIRRQAAVLFPSNPSVAARCLPNDTIIRLAQRALHIPVAITYMEEDVLEHQRWECAANLVDLYEHSNMRPEARAIRYQPELQPFILRPSLSTLLNPQLMEVIGDVDRAIHLYEQCGVVGTTATMTATGPLHLQQQPNRYGGGSVSAPTTSMAMHRSTSGGGNAQDHHVAMLRSTDAIGSTTIDDELNNFKLTPFHRGGASFKQQQQQRLEQRSTVPALPPALPHALQLSVRDAVSSLVHILRSINKTYDFQRTVDYFSVLRSSTTSPAMAGLLGRCSTANSPVMGFPRRRAGPNPTAMPLEVARQVALAAHCLGNWDLVHDVCVASGVKRHLRYSSFSSDNGILPNATNSRKDNTTSKELLLYSAASDIARGLFDGAAATLESLRGLLTDSSHVLHVESAKRRSDLNMMFLNMTDMEEALQILQLPSRAAAATTAASNGGSNDNGALDDEGPDGGVTGIMVSPLVEGRLSVIGGRTLPPLATALHRAHAIAFRATYVSRLKQLRNLFVLSEQLYSEGFPDRAQDTLRVAGSAIRGNGATAPAAAVLVARHDHRYGVGGSKSVPIEYRSLMLESMKLGLESAGVHNSRLGELQATLRGMLATLPSWNAALASSLDTVEGEGMRSLSATDTGSHHTAPSSPVGPSSPVFFDESMLEYRVELMVLDLEVSRRLTGFHLFPTNRRGGRLAPSPSYAAAVDNHHTLLTGAGQPQYRLVSVPDTRDLQAFMSLFETSEGILTEHLGATTDANFATSLKEFSLLYFDVCKTLRAEWVETTETADKMQVLTRFRKASTEAVVALQKAAIVCTHACERSIGGSSSTAGAHNGVGNGGEANARRQQQTNAAASGGGVPSNGGAATAASVASSPTVRAVPGSSTQTAALGGAGASVNSTGAGFCCFASRRRISTARMNITISDLLLKALNAAWNGSCIEDLNFSPDMFPSWALLGPYLVHYASRSKTLETHVVQMCQQSLAMLAQLSFHLIATYETVGERMLSSSSPLSCPSGASSPPSQRHHDKPERQQADNGGGPMSRSASNVGAAAAVAKFQQQMVTATTATATGGRTNNASGLLRFAVPTQQLGGEGPAMTSPPPPMTSPTEGPQLATEQQRSMVSRSSIVTEGSSTHYESAHQHQIASRAAAQARLSSTLCAHVPLRVWWDAQLAATAVPATHAAGGATTAAVLRNHHMLQSAHHQYPQRATSVTPAWVSAEQHHQTNDANPPLFAMLEVDQPLEHRSTIAGALNHAAPRDIMGLRFASEMELIGDASLTSPNDFGGGGSTTTASVMPLPASTQDGGALHRHDDAGAGGAQADSDEIEFYSDIFCDDPPPPPPVQRHGTLRPGSSRPPGRNSFAAPPDVGAPRASATTGPWTTVSPGQTSLGVLPQHQQPHISVGGGFSRVQSSMGGGGGMHRGGGSMPSLYSHTYPQPQPALLHVAPHHDVILTIAKTSPQHRSVLHGALKFARWVASGEETQVTFEVDGTSMGSRVVAGQQQQRTGTMRPLHSTPGGGTSTVWPEGLRGCPLPLPSWHIRHHFSKPIALRTSIVSSRRVHVTTPAPPYGFEEVLWMTLNDGMRLKFHHGLVPNAQGGPHGAPSTKLGTLMHTQPHTTSNAVADEEVDAVDDARPQPQRAKTHQHHDHNRPAHAPHPATELVQACVVPVCRCHAPAWNNDSAATTANGEGMDGFEDVATPFSARLQQSTQAPTRLRNCSPCTVEEAGGSGDGREHLPRQSMHALPIALMSSAFSHMVEQLPFLNLRRSLVIPLSAINAITQLMTPHLLVKEAGSAAADAASQQSLMQPSSASTGSGGVVSPSSGGGVPMDASSAPRFDEGKPKHVPLRHVAVPSFYHLIEATRLHQAAEARHKCSSTPSGNGGPSLRALTIRARRDALRLADVYDSGAVNLRRRRDDTSSSEDCDKSFDALRTMFREVGARQQSEGVGSFISNHGSFAGPDAKADVLPALAAPPPSADSLALAARVELLKLHRTERQDDLRKMMLTEASDPPQWLEARAAYAKQLAEWSMLQYVFDIACRCPAFFVLDLASGHITQLELGNHAMATGASSSSVRSNNPLGSNLSTRDASVFRMTSAMQRALPMSSAYSGFLLHAAESLRQVQLVRKELIGVIEYGLEGLRVATTTAVPGSASASPWSGGPGGGRGRWNPLDFETEEDAATGTRVLHSRASPLLDQNHPKGTTAAQHTGAESHGLLQLPPSLVGGGASTEALSSLGASRRRSMDPSSCTMRRASDFPYGEPLLQLEPFNLSGTSPVPLLQEEDCPPHEASLEADEEGYDVACFDGTSAIVRLNEVLHVAPAIRGPLLSQHASDAAPSRRSNSGPRATNNNSTKDTTTTTVNTSSWDDFFGCMHSEAAKRIQRAFRLWQRRCNRPSADAATATGVGGGSTQAYRSPLLTFQTNLTSPDRGGKSAAGGGGSEGGTTGGILHAGVTYHKVSTYQERVASLIEAATNDENIAGLDWTTCPHPWLTWCPHW